MSDDAIKTTNAEEMEDSMSTEMSWRSMMARSGLIGVGLAAALAVIYAVKPDIGKIQATAEALRDISAKQAELASALATQGHTLERTSAIQLEIAKRLERAADKIDGTLQGDRR